MKRVAGLLIALAFMAGCERDAKTALVGTVTSDAVHDEVFMRDFTKVWHYQVTPDVQLNVTTILTPWLRKCDSYSCGTYALQFVDQLTQSDGKLVVFDCDKVAEKIIDRDLVSKVEVSCSAVHEMATAYWKGNGDPSEFTDHSGRVWKRQ